MFKPSGVFSQILSHIPTVLHTHVGRESYKMFPYRDNSHHVASCKQLPCISFYLEPVYSRVFPTEHKNIIGILIQCLELQGHDHATDKLTTNGVNRLQWIAYSVLSAIHSMSCL